MALYNVQLGTSETNLITNGGSTNIAVLSMTFCNTDSTARTITVYAYPSGGSANATSTIISALSINPGDTYVWTTDEKFILAPNDKISAISDVSAKVSACVNSLTL